MVKNAFKLKKGGIDTIVAFIIVLLPLVYVLIFMVATLYHFTVQMYLNQAVKETIVMASTYGDCTEEMEKYLIEKAKKVAGDIEIVYYVREFYNKSGKVSAITPAERIGNTIKYISTDEDESYCGHSVSLKKADLFGIYIKSESPSLLGTVSNFNIFSANEPDIDTLCYTAYREEIIRNDD